MKIKTHNFLDSKEFLIFPMIGISWLFGFSIFFGWLGWGIEIELW